MSKTARQLAEEENCESVEQLFTQMVQTFNAGLHINAMGNFNSLKSIGQEQLLRYCASNDDNAYKFFHSLI